MNARQNVASLVVINFSFNSGAFELEPRTTAVELQRQKETVSHRSNMANGEA